MWTYVKINSDQAVDLEFSEGNKKAIYEKFEKWNNREERWPARDLKKLSYALDMLNDYPYSFEVEATVDEVELSEDNVDDAYEDIHGSTDTYDDGYEAAMERVNECKKYVNNNYALLMQKLERLAYNYGNPEPLTQDEIRKIKDLIDGLITTL